MKGRVDPARKAMNWHIFHGRDMDVVERVVPVTEESPHKSRRGSYRLRDPFFRFWFRFVYPFRSELEAGEAEWVLRTRIRPHFPEFVGPVFEEVARQPVRSLARRGGIPLEPARVGAGWDGAEEIDVVAVDEERPALLVGECKWWSGPVGENVLAALRRRTGVLLSRTAGRWRQPPQVAYALFSRSGFTPELRVTAEREGVLLVEAAEM